MSLPESGSVYFRHEPFPFDISKELNKAEEFIKKYPEKFQPGKNFIETKLFCKDLVDKFAFYSGSITNLKSNLAILGPSEDATIDDPSNVYTRVKGSAIFVGFKIARAMLELESSIARITSPELFLCFKIENGDDLSRLWTPFSSVESLEFVTGSNAPVN